MMYPGITRICASLVTAIFILTGAAVSGQVIVADNYNVTGSGTGFALNTGVNSGINPPTTRLTGHGGAEPALYPDHHHEDEHRVQHRQQQAAGHPGRQSRKVLAFGRWHHRL